MTESNDGILGRRAAELQRAKRWVDENVDMTGFGEPLAMELANLIAAVRAETLEAAAKACEAVAAAQPLPFDEARDAALECARAIEAMK